MDAIHPEKVDKCFGDLQVIKCVDLQIEQVGSPRELYERPDNLFVAQFIGSPKMNVMPCSAEGDRFKLPGHGEGSFVHAAAGGEPAHLGIRPEHIEVVEPVEGHCSGVVEVTEYPGADVMLYLNCGELGVLTVRHVGDIDAKPGQNIGLRFDESRLHFFGNDEQAIRSDHV